ncbi:hypothetical protein HO614_03940 [Streptococcus suis]|nr:hypothetical protein [Streptococcus suis]NQP64917.1 hypothetical protein [Streptococcus suis]
MKTKALFFVIGTGLILSACGNKQAEVYQPSVSQSQPTDASTTTVNSQEDEHFFYGETIPADEVHTYKNYSSSKGKLDKDGIYRYDFLSDDDSVYEAMSYQEVDKIIPVHEQKKINVTLGTNFTINNQNFNLYNQSMRSIVETISDLEYDDAYGQVIGNLPNGRTSSTQVFQPILFNNEDSAVVKVTYSVINTQRRMVSGEDVAVYKFSIEGDLGNKELNPWDSISFEGINLGITRNQFIDNVKINNPIFNNPDDSSFQTADFFDKAFVKEKDIRSISYVLDERLDEKGRPSYVRFMFRNEILTRIDVNCTLDYLDLEVQ